MLDFLEKHQAPYLKAEDVLAAALADAKKQEKRLLLTFGAPWCGWCHRFEDWIERKDVEALLRKDFVVAKIDIDRTVGGKDVLKRYGAEEGEGIPFFAFVEPDGSLVANSRGPNGNVGCPWSDEEVTIFGEILSRSSSKLTAEDIDKLKALLVEERKRVESAQHSGG